MSEGCVSAVLLTRHQLFLSGARELISDIISYNVNI